MKRNKAILAIFTFVVTLSLTMLLTIQSALAQEPETSAKTRSSVLTDTVQVPALRSLATSEFTFTHVVDWPQENAAVLDDFFNSLPYSGKNIALLMQETGIVTSASVGLLSYERAEWVGGGPWWNRRVSSDANLAPFFHQTISQTTWVVHSSSTFSATLVLTAGDPSSVVYTEHRNGIVERQKSFDTVSVFSTTSQYCDVDATHVVNGDDVHSVFSLECGQLAAGSGFRSDPHSGDESNSIIIVAGNAESDAGGNVGSFITIRINHCGTGWLANDGSVVEASHTLTPPWFGDSGCQNRPAAAWYPEAQGFRVDNGTLLSTMVPLGSKIESVTVDDQATTSYTFWPSNFQLEGGPITESLVVNELSCAGGQNVVATLSTGETLTATTMPCPKSRIYLPLLRKAKPAPSRPTQ